jgi:hypothetical protein
MDGYLVRFACSALALGNREQKENANNHCSGEQSGSKTPGVTIGSALREPGPNILLNTTIRSSSSKSFGSKWHKNHSKR